MFSSAVTLVNVIYNYKFNRRNSKFLQLFLKTKNITQRDKTQYRTRFLLSGLKVSDLLCLVADTITVVDRTIGTIVFCSICHWCLILKIILALFVIGLWHLYILARVGTFKSCLRYYFLWLFDVISTLLRCCDVVFYHYQC